MSTAATGIGTGPTIAFVGVFSVPLLSGLVADLTGFYGASWPGLSGWAVVGVVFGFLVREHRKGAIP